MDSRKTAAYIGLLMFFLILSLVLSNYSLALLSLPILSAVFLTSILQPRTPTGLTLQREIDPPFATTRISAQISITVANESEKTVRSIAVIDHLPPQAEIESGTNRIVVNLKPQEKVAFGYRLKPLPRGLYQVGGASAEVSDPLGLFSLKASLGDPSFLYVYPQLSEGQLRITPRRTAGWWGSTPSRKTGTGVEFYGLRDYQPGDELRDINWKATARLGKIVTNEFEAERASDTVLLIDAGRYSGTMSGEKSLLDYEAEAGLSIASFLIRTGNRVGMILHGKFRHWVYPSFGGRQYQKIREQLMLARPGDSQIPLSFLVSQLAPMILTPGSQVILIAHPFSLELSESVASLHSLGYRTSLLLIQPYMSGENASSAASTAARILLLGAMETVAELRQMCPTVTWQGDEALERALKRLSLWARRTMVFPD